MNPKRLQAARDPHGMPPATESFLAGPLRHPITVETAQSRRQRDTFVRFPWQIYRHDPYWVPPLMWERKQFIHPAKHPFYRHGTAVQLLATHNGEPVGRIQASDDPHYNAEHGTNLGCFGMFECIDDPQVAGALLDAAAAWLAARGRDRIMGPIDYSTNYSCGLLIDGFDTPPRVMMNHNPPYYAGLLGAWGLEKVKDLYSWWFDDPHDMIELWKSKAERLGQRSGISIRSLDPRRFEQELETVKAIYNEAWQRNWGFVKMTDAEIRHFGKLLLTVAVPEMLLVAEVDGNPAGLSLSLPDLNEALKPLNGRLTRFGLPLGLLRLRRGLKQVRSCRLFTLGVMEAYRRRGVAEMLILKSLDYAKNVIGFTGAELGWTLEDNDLINRTIEAVGGEHYKTYRIYERPIV